MIQLWIHEKKKKNEYHFIMPITDLVSKIYRITGHAISNGGLRYPVRSKQVIDQEGDNEADYYTANRKED